jgi:hypothetical protein
MTERKIGKPLLLIGLTRMSSPGQRLGASLAFCVLAVLISHRGPGDSPVRLTGSVSARPYHPRFAGYPLGCPHPPRTPSEAALHEARWLWGQAIMHVKPALEAEAEADPGGAPYQESTRRRLMATQEGPTLRRAAGAARRALSLARAPEERFQATVWLACIECDRGHHGEELRLARSLRELRPGSAESLVALRRAARCNGLSRVAWQADQALRTLRGAPPAASFSFARRRLEQPVPP